MTRSKGEGSSEAVGRRGSADGSASGDPDSVVGKPWRIYPEGTRKSAANWPIELHEAWAESDKLRADLAAEKNKSARLRERLKKAETTTRRPPWRRKS